MPESSGTRLSDLLPGGSGSSSETPQGDPPGPAARVIDAHVHVFPPELIRERTSLLQRDPWFGVLYADPAAAMADAEQVVEAMDADGVDEAVVFGFAFRDQGLCRLVNDYVLDSVARYPGRLAGLCCVSPRMPGAVAELERCLEAGLRGCGELAPDGQGLLEDENGRPGSAVKAVAARLAERELPLLIHSNEPIGHSYAGKGAFTPPACYALAAAYPDLTIVFAHMGGGLFLYELMPEVRRTLARAYYDTSAAPYLYGPEVYEVAAKCAGAGKLVFGSDFPLLAPGRYREGMARLDGPGRAAVLGDNARKVFRL